MFASIIRESVGFVAKVMSNYADLSFSDEEIIAIYLFGVMNKHREIKGIYEYADCHLRNWFPQLPSYVAYIQRLNRVADVFTPLFSKGWPIDSFPMALAKQGHRFNVCVAKEVADLGLLLNKEVVLSGYPSS